MDHRDILHEALLTPSLDVMGFERRGAGFCSLRCLPPCRSRCRTRRRWRADQSSETHHASDAVKWSGWINGFAAQRRDGDALRQPGQAGPYLVLMKWYPP